MPTARFTRLPLIAAILACASPTAPRAEGDWGGTEASLSLSRTGGTLSYPCGSGTIDPAWSVDRDGQLSAKGQHFTGGGPLPIQGRPPRPARYSGRIRGAMLILTVTLTDSGEILGPFRLERGGPPVQEQCD